MFFWKKKEPPTWPLPIIDTIDNTEQLLVLGHQIKYNLYLMSKSIVFSALLKANDYNATASLNQTQEIMATFHEQDHSRE